MKRIVLGLAFIGALVAPAVPAAGGQIIETVVKPPSSFQLQDTATDIYLNLGGYGSSRHGQGKFDADGNFIFAESGNNVIRKLNTTTGMLTTIAGTGEPGLSGDGGLAIYATLNNPNDVAIEPVTGNIYISDMVNNSIRMIYKNTGVIIRIGGDGVTRADGGDGGQVISATFNRPRGLGFDSAGNLYICNSDAGTLRKVTYAAGDPWKRIITRVAGLGGSWAEGVPAGTASLKYPFGLHVTPGGVLYIGGWSPDGPPSEGHRVRKVEGGVINTVAGQLNRGDDANGVNPATTALMNEVRGVVLDKNGNIYIADQLNHRIRKVDVGANTISTLVGTGVAGYSGDDGAAILAQIYRPHGVAYWPDPDAGKIGILYIMDQNHVIRKVDLDDADKTITTVAGKGPAPATISINGPAFIAKNPKIGHMYFGHMYFSNLGGHTVMRFDPSTGATAIVAGTGTAGSTGDTGPATDATLNGPTGVAFDAAGNLYIAESSGATGHRVRKVDADTGIISTLVNSAGGSGVAGVDGELASAAKLNTPRGMAFDSAGDLYIADQGNNRIRKVTMSAVPPTVSSYWTGLNSPRDIVFDTRLATRDDLYCADLGNHAVKMKAWVGGAVTTVAGGNGQGFGGDGGLPTAPAAKLSNPYGVTLDPTGSYLYIGDYSNYRVRRVDLAPGGFISTFAGDGDTDRLDDGGPPQNAGLSVVMGLAFDANSYLYICDYGNSRIRRVTPSDESDLSVGLSATPLALAVGATSTATVTLQNSGLVRANAILTITLPAGLSLQSASTTQGAFDTGTLVWNPGNVCVWTSPTLTLVLEGVADGTGDVTAELTTSDRTDPDSTPGNNVPAEDDQASVSVEVSGGDGATLYWHPQGASANGNLATNWTTKQAGLVRVVSVNATHNLSFGGTGTNADNDCTLQAGLTCASINSTGYGGAFSTANFNVTTGTLAWPAGTFDAGSSTVTLTGTGTPLTAGGTINAGSSTFKYAPGPAGTDQTVAAVTYHHLEIDNGTKTATAGGNFTVGGNLVMTSGTFDVANQTVTVSGNVAKAAGATSNLVGWWKFDEGADKVANDSSGNTSHGALRDAPNTPAWVNGKIGGALQFNATAVPLFAPYVTVPHKASLSITTDFAIAFWIKRGETNSYGGILAKSLDFWSADDYDFDVYIDTDNKVKFWTGGALDANLASTGTIADTTTWHHVVMTRSGNTVTFYIDGNSAGTDTLVGALPDNAYDLWIGNDVAEGNFGGYPDVPFQGSLDDVRIYNRALSSAEVAVLAGGQIKIGGTGVLDANGSYDMSGGATTFTGAGRLELGGAVTSLGTFTSNGGGTVSYDSGGAQSVQAVTYYHLEINKSAGAATAAGSFAAGGNLTISSGTFEGGANTISVAGNWTNNGTFTPNTSTVTFNGSAAQAITTGGTGAGKVFNNLEVNKSGGTATAAGDIGCASFTQVVTNVGTFTTGGKNLTSSGAVTVNGGTFRLVAASTLSCGGDFVVSDAGGTNPYGTLEVPGTTGTATITFTANGTMTLAGAVDVGGDWVSESNRGITLNINGLGDGGLTLSGSTGTAGVFNNVKFLTGTAGGQWMTIEGSDWDATNLRGLGFKDTKATAVVMGMLDPSDYVVMSFYEDDTVAGWISGDNYDKDSDHAPATGVGKCFWLPTAAEGLTAQAERVPKGVLVSWQVLSERDTIGYVVLRRPVPTLTPTHPQTPTPPDRPECTGQTANMQHATCNTQHAMNGAGEGGWKKLTEVPAASFGGEPTGSQYSWLDESAKSDEQFEYAIQELEGTGQMGKRCQAEGPIQGPTDR